MAQFSTFYILRNKGHLYVPGLPSLPEFGKRHQYTRSAVNRGIDRLAINYYDSAFVIDPVESDKYRIRSYYYPEILLKWVVDSAGRNLVVATKEFDQYSLFTAEITQSSEYRYGVMRLKGYNGMYYCIDNTTASNGYLSNTVPAHIMDIVIIDHNY